MKTLTKPDNRWPLMLVKMYIYRKYHCKYFRQYKCIQKRLMPFHNPESTPNSPTKRDNPIIQCSFVYQHKSGSLRFFKVSCFCFSSLIFVVSQVSIFHFLYRFNLSVKLPNVFFIFNERFY